LQRFVRRGLAMAKQCAAESDNSGRQTAARTTAAQEYLSRIHEIMAHYGLR